MEAPAGLLVLDLAGEDWDRDRAALEVIVAGSAFKPADGRADAVRRDLEARRCANAERVKGQGGDRRPGPAGPLAGPGPGGERRAEGGGTRRGGD